MESIAPSPPFWLKCSAKAPTATSDPCPPSTLLVKPSVRPCNFTSAPSSQLYHCISPLPGPAPPPPGPSLPSTLLSCSLALPSSLLSYNLALPSTLLSSCSLALPFSLLSYSLALPSTLLSYSLVRKSSLRKLLSLTPV